jgi:putative transposase
VLGDRYKSIYIDGDSPLYYQSLMDYIHLNPIRAGLVGKAKGTSLLDYPWSSLAGGYALAPGKRAPWLAAEYGLKSFGLADTTAGRKAYVERLDWRVQTETLKRCGLPPELDERDGRLSQLRKGCWGKD